MLLTPVLPSKKTLLLKTKPLVVMVEQCSFKILLLTSEVTLKHRLIKIMQRSGGAVYTDLDSHI